MRTIQKIIIIVLIHLIKRHKIKSVSLKKNPFKERACVKILTRTPKKPNSALRKISKVTKTFYLIGRKNDLSPESFSYFVKKKHGRQV